jgi:hypothetical protein
MTCAEARSRLLDLLYEELSGEERSAVLGHLEACEPCRGERAALQTVLSAADRWTPPPPPRGIAERAVARVALARARAVARPVIALQHVLAFAVAGVAATALSLVLVGGGGDLQESALKVGLAGAVWVALYGGAGLLTQSPKHRRIAVAALLAAGVSTLLAPVLSMPDVIEACRRWLEAAQGSPLLNGLVATAGTLYAATPVFVSGATVTRRRPGVVADAARLAGVYALLLAPSVYLQCHPLSMALIAPWVVGVVVGCWLGSLGGMSIAPRARPVSA